MERQALIIGGGVAGLSLAAELAREMPVTLLEREAQPGYHASGRSAAAYVPGYGNPVIRALTDASRAAFDASGTLTQRGMMLLARHGEEDDFAREVAQFGLEVITAQEAQARVPILNPAMIAGAAIKSEVWDIDTDALLAQFTKAARAAGARIVTGAEISAIAHNGAGWDVTAGEHFTAPILVNAAGAWADEIAKMAGVAPIGLTPLRRSMARIPAPGGHDVSGWPFLNSVNERWYAKPDAGALIVSPADEDPSAPMDVFADDMVLAEGLARYEEMVTTPVTRLLSNWAGLRSFAPDRTPVLGFDPQAPGFVWCAAQGGYGFQTAPAAARLVCDLITGADHGALPPEIIADLAPARLRAR